MNLKDCIEGYILFKSTACSPRTIETAQSFFKQFVSFVGGETDIKDVTQDHIRDYIEQLKARNLSKHTIRRHYSVLSALYTWLSSSEIALVDTHIVKLVGAPKEPKLRIQTYSQDDIKALLSACSKSRLPRRAKALILFLLDTGARISEVSNVKIENVDFKTGRVLIMGKGSKQRYTYLGKRALQSLWLYVHNERKEPAQQENDFVFLSSDGYGLDRHSLRKIITRLGAIANVKAYPHKFRHSCAVQRLREGMDLATLRHMMGHEHVQTTMQYLSSLQDDDTENKAKRTSPSDSWKL